MTGKAVFSRAVAFAGAFGAATGFAAICFVLPVFAQDASAAPSFTFKRVPVIQGQSGRRITVQIDPVAQAAALAALPKVPLRDAGAAPDLGPMAPTAPSTAAYAWYWDLVDPVRANVSGRFETALAALSQGPSGARVAAPRLQAMQGLAQTYGTEILKATIGTNVSPALVLAVMAIESGGRADAVSPKGATGLMQLIPATAARFGVADSTVPAQNIKGGVAYLNWLMDEFDRDPLMVLAAYNAGEGAVRANDGIPPYAETRDYVPKVLAAWTAAAGLCATPPMLVSDPCVFKVIAAGG
jgi:soluble lytic murein transglycosylase-like protein